MVKYIALAVIVVLATLGGSVAAIKLGAVDDERAAAPRDIVEIVRLEQASVPVIRRGAVVGYVLAQLSFAAAANDLKSDKQALTIYVTEAGFSTVFEEDGFDFASLRTVQIATLADRMLKRANDRIGRDAIKKVVIESLAFLDQGAVRCRRS